MSTTVIYSLIGVDGASPAFRAAGDSADDLDSKFGKLGKAAQLAGIAIAAGAGVIAVESVKAAVAFQASMEKIHTQAGASQASVESLTKSVLKLAPSTEQGPQALADALYHLKSLGMDNATAMKALATTSNLAAVGGSNLEDTATAIGAAWRSGIKGGKDFTQTAATVNAIIGAGNMTMTDFVDSLSSGILPAARTWGVSLTSIGSALALLTDEGVPAIDGATRLRMTLSLMGHQSAPAAKALASIGLGSTSLATAMRGPQGIIGAVQLLKTHLDDSGLSAVKQAQVLSEAFGGGKSSSTIMTLVNNLGVLKQKQDQTTKSIGAYGGAVIAQRKTASAQFALLKSAVDTLGIRLGLALLPPVTRFVGYLNKTVLPDVRKIIGWLTSPDVKPWAQIAGELTLAAAGATAIYSGLKKASEITGIGKILAGAKKPQPSVTTAAATNMGTAADTMYSASLNMLKAAGISDVPAPRPGAGEKTTTPKDTESTAGGGTAKNLGTSALVALPIAGAIIQQFPKGPGGAWVNSWAPYEKIFTNDIPKAWSIAYEAFQVEFAGKITSWFTRSLPSYFTRSLPDIWSHEYQAFQRDFAGKLTSWFTKSLPHFFTSTVPDKIWSVSYQAFQRDFAGKLTAWFTQSLPHAFEVAGSTAAHALATGFDDGKHWVLAAAGKVEGWVTAPFAKAPAWLVSTGQDIVRGLINGIGSLAGDVTTALLDLIPGPLRKFAKKLGIASPSKVFYNLGTMITAGLANGITMTASKAEKAAASLAAQVAAAFGAGQITSSQENSLLSRITTKLSSDLTSLQKSQAATRAAQLGAQITAKIGSGITETIPQAEKAATKLMAAIGKELAAGKISASQGASLVLKVQSDLTSRKDKVVKTLKTIGLEMQAGLLASLSGTSATASQVKGAVNKLIGYVKTAWQAGAITTQKASALTAGLEKDNTRLQSLATARSKIAATIATATAYATSTASNVASGAQLTTLLSNAGGVIDGAGIISGLQGQLTSIKKFASDITRLKALGLGTALLGQIIAAGPVDGDQLAQALITSGAGGIKQANQAQAAITKASTALGQSAANLMYDSGKQAGKGFLSGLEAQQASITKLMTSIAKSMVATLKKELGIHSPSKVTRQIGEFTGIGIEEGMLSRVRHIEGAASRLAVAAVPAPRAPAASSSAQAPAAATGGAFTGNLYLDSGELLGVVRGEMRKHDKKLLKSANAGSGLNG